MPRIKLIHRTKGYDILKIPTHLTKRFYEKLEDEMDSHLENYPSYKPLDLHPRDVLAHLKSLDHGRTAKEISEKI